MALVPSLEFGVAALLPATRAPRPSAPVGSTVMAMATAATRDEAELEAEEARLARAAAAGDGEAFATLYERYARRAYNLALRLSGSEDDAADAVQEAFVKVMRRLPELGEERDLAFGSYLFTATRNAAYDLIRRHQRAASTDSIPDSAVPVGAGAGGLGLDPGDPEEDPDRRVLLASQQEEIREANARLPERQREALALRELEGLSYDEIAELMEMNRNSVAQLISRARINLRDELRGGALASIAASSPGCERALPLIAMRDDGQLEPGSSEDAWLSSHLAGCDTCGLATEAMQEAGASYRLWVPLAIAPALFKATMARAAELTGADWSEVVERRLEAPTDTAELPGLPSAYQGASAGASGSRRRGLLVAALAALLLAAGVAVGFAGGLDDSTPPRAKPVAEEPLERSKSAPKPEPRRTKPEPRATPVAAEPEAATVTEAPESDPPLPPSPAGTESAPPSSAPTEATGGGLGGAGSADSTRDPAPEPEPEPLPEAPPTVTEPPPEREPEEPPWKPPGGPGDLKSP